MGEISFIGIPVWEIAKFFVLFGLLIYVVFSFVIVRQVKLMIDTLQVGHEGLIRFFSYIHLLFSISFFVFAIIIL